MRVDIINPEDNSVIDRDIEILKVYAGDLMLNRKGRRRFEFDRQWQKNDFLRGITEYANGYLKGQGGHDTVLLRRVDNNSK